MMVPMPEIGDRTAIGKKFDEVMDVLKSPKRQTDIETLSETAHKLGVSDERLRILRALDKADLPAGVWPLIKDIICP